MRAIALGGALMIGGCVAGPSPEVLDTFPPPPPPQAEVAPPRPSAASVWVPGHWDWLGRQREYVWVPGRWAVPATPRQVWVPGHWARYPGGYAWVEGHWEVRP